MEHVCFSISTHLLTVYATESCAAVACGEVYFHVAVNILAPLRTISHLL